MRTIAIVNRKGGSCKTTTTVELAYILATICHQRVLVVDCDSQGDATSTLLGRSFDHDGTAAALQYGLEYYPDVIEQTDVKGLDVLPAGESLAQVDMECMLGKMSPVFTRLRGLMACLAEDDSYDVVLMDCPPYYSLSCINAIVAADYVIIPTTLDAYSTVGMQSLLAQIRDLRTICPNVKVAGALITRYKNNDVSQDAESYLREEFPVRVFQTVIRRSEDKMEECTWAGKSSQEWSPFCNCAKDYRALVRELIELEVLPHE